MTDKAIRHPTTEPGYCDRCGHPLALHAEAGLCMFTCDCEDGMCLCNRTDLDRSCRSSPAGVKTVNERKALP